MHERSHALVPLVRSALVEDVSEVSVSIVHVWWLVCLSMNGSARLGCYMDVPLLKLKQSTVYPLPISVAKASLE